MITVVIFDVGGVLYKQSYKGYMFRAFVHFSKKFHLDKNAVEQACRSSEHMVMSGKETTQTFLLAVSRKLGTNIPLDEFVRILKDERHLDSRMLQLVLRLKKTHSVIVLSDDMRESSRTIKKQLRPYFHRMYFSCDVGIQKPSSRIFRHVCNDLGVKPQDCLFIDDKQENVASAQKAGMHAVQFISYKELLN